MNTYLDLRTRFRPDERLGRVVEHERGLPLLRL